MTDIILHRVGGMGDVLMACAAAKAIKHLLPGSRVALEVGLDLVELVRLCPHLDWEVRPGAIFCDIRGAMLGVQDYHQIDAYLRAIGLDPGRVPPQQKTVDLIFPRAPKLPRSVSIHTHSTDPNRTYPRWPEVITGLVDRGFNIVKITSEYSWVESLQRIDMTDVFVSTDSGPIQLAGATSAAIVGIYSVVPGHARLPFNHVTRAINLAECSYHPCYKHFFRPGRGPEVRAELDKGRAPAEILGAWCPKGGYACLRDLDPMRIVDAVCELT